jgi:signal transduction histidine kinase
MPNRPHGSVREQLLAKVDEITGHMAELLEEVRTVTEQLHPERARSCRNAITMCRVMVDEIRLRAYARPLDEAEP